MQPATMWSNDVVLRLIELYRSFEYLWDAKNNHYKNLNKKHDAWEEMSKILNIYLNVTASLTLASTGSRNLVFCLDIDGDILYKSISKSVDDIRVKL